MFGVVKGILIDQIILRGSLGFNEATSVNFDLMCSTESYINSSFIL